MEKDKGKVVEISGSNTERKKDGVITMEQGNLNGKVSRKELIEIMSQVIENINTISQYVMDDMNVMYQNYVFPLQMRVAVMEDVLKEKGLCDEKDLTERTAAKIRELQEAAEAKLREKESEESNKEASEK